MQNLNLAGDAEDCSEIENLAQRSQTALTVAEGPSGLLLSLVQSCTGASNSHQVIKQ